MSSYEQECASYGCRQERMSDHAHCPICTIQIEKEYGRGGFGPHGREPSDLTNLAYAEFDRRVKEKQCAAPKR